MKMSLPAAFFMLFTGFSSAFGAPRTVAVVNFTNHTGGIGLQYLSKSLPESIAATLSQSKYLRVVERQQIGKLLDEIALEQTGVFDEKEVNRAGRMARADVLILGSYSGSPDDIVLSLKAVDVATGDVLDGRVVKAPLAKIFDMANQAALAMAVVISGGRTGLLSVSSTPDHADLYIDGMLVGQTPVVEYKIAEGSHRLMAAKRGYLDAETTVTVLAGRHERWSPYLVQERVKDRGGVELAAFYFAPTYKELDPAPYYVAAYGRTFDRFFLSGEIGYSSIDHNQTYESPFGVEITQERFYTLFTLQGHLSYAPFPRLEKVQPYAGLFAGWGILTDFRKIATAEDDDEKLGEEDLFNLGLKAGVVLFPYSRFNLFIEGRFFWTPKEVTRIVYESQGIMGDVVPHETQYYFNALILGGGLRYFF